MHIFVEHHTARLDSLRANLKGPLNLVILTCEIKTDYGFSICSLIYLRSVIGKEFCVGQKKRLYMQIRYFRTNGKYFQNATFIA